MTTLIITAAVSYFFGLLTAFMIWVTGGPKIPPPHEPSNVGKLPATHAVDYSSEEGRNS